MAEPSVSAGRPGAGDRETGARASYQTQGTGRAVPASALQAKARDAVSPARPGPKWLVDALAVLPVYIGEDRGQLGRVDAVEVEVHLARCFDCDARR